MCVFLTSLLCGGGKHFTGIAMASELKGGEGCCEIVVRPVVLACARSAARALAVCAIPEHLTRKKNTGYIASAPCFFPHLPSLECIEKPIVHPLQYLAAR
jgi:hypothetical protein